jgi:hypothetical protein
VLSYSQWLASGGAETSQESRERMLAIIQDHTCRLYELLGALRQYIHGSELGATDFENAALTPLDSNVAATANLQGLIEESGAAVEWDVLPTV